MKDLNAAIKKLKGHIERRDKISGSEFAQDVVEAFQAISLRLAALEARENRPSVRQA